MLPSPHEIARQIQHHHRPGWLVWFGPYTKQYWALARWVRASHMLSASTPDELVTAITAFETHHPKPVQQSTHVVAN